jgi:hypothetical protein
MNQRKGLVLDANILLRAVFGIQVRQVLEAYEHVAAFYSPDVCFAEAEIHPRPDQTSKAGFDTDLIPSEKSQGEEAKQLSACTRASVRTDEKVLFVDGGGDGHVEEADHHFVVSLVPPADGDSGVGIVRVVF